jgi:hypothetical protein
MRLFLNIKIKSIFNLTVLLTANLVAIYWHFLFVFKQKRRFWNTWSKSFPNITSLSYIDTCFWYSNNNVVFGILKASHFPMWRFLREGLGARQKLARTKSMLSSSWLLQTQTFTKGVGSYWYFLLNPFLTCTDRFLLNSFLTCTDKLHWYFLMNSFLKCPDCFLLNPFVTNIDLLY